MASFRICKAGTQRQRLLPNKQESHTSTNRLRRAGYHGIHHLFTPRWNVIILAGLGAGKRVLGEVICDGPGPWETRFGSREERMKGVLLQPFVACNPEE